MCSPLQKHPSDGDPKGPRERATAQNPTLSITASLSKAESTRPGRGTTGTHMSPVGVQIGALFLKTIEQCL